ncbi:MAG: Na+/H+ antiporter NhaC family protein [Acidobacteriota bacterium]|nr:Na+/H+ antiporter NhaC family protein [Acidobacteriota bacterium]
MSATGEAAAGPVVRFVGGVAGALFPFILFVAGVVTVALSGAPDERGFWPILILSLTVGLLLAREKRAYCETVIRGMAQPIVMIMITAWMLASSVGVLMSDTGLVEGLVWAAGQLRLEGAAFAAAAFLICGAVSVATGTSFGTILICGPILFPAGGLAGASPAVLAGAILAGATFGDSIAPISDTTIAAALSQNADIGKTVRRRLRYVLPAGAVALIAYALIPGGGAEGLRSAAPVEGSPAGLPMILVPVLIIVLLLRGRHLLEGLLIGLLSGTVLGLILGRLAPGRLLTLDAAEFSAGSFIIDGINRAVGISFFTILLMGLVAAVEAGGPLRLLVDAAAARSRTLRSTESWIVGAVSAAVLVTCHSIVAVLTVGPFARRIGESMGISPTRRANLLSLSVSTYPFLLPYFIPVILTANATRSGAPFGIEAVSPLQTGLFNIYSWALLAVLAAALFLGYGRARDR